MCLALPTVYLELYILALTTVYLELYILALTTVYLELYMSSSDYCLSGAIYV